MPTPLDEYCSDAGRLYDIVAFGGSAGGITALMQILSLLPPNFRIPILAVQHLPRSGPTILPAVLGYRTSLTVKWAEQDEHPQAGIVYVAPPNHHLTISDDGLLDLSSTLPLINHFKPAIDPLFESVARVFGRRAIAIVLSGMLDDGTRGSASVRHCGGVTMAQDEATSMHFDMPCAAIDFAKNEGFSLPKIAEALCAVGLA